MRYGSLQNVLMDGSRDGGTVAVGTGVTMLHWTDREPGTVIEVSKSGRTIIVQEDDAVRTDSNGMSEVQAYQFTPNPNGAKVKATLRRDGTFRVVGSQARVLIGTRIKYHDYSF